MPSPRLPALRLLATLLLADGALVSRARLWDALSADFPMGRMAVESQLHYLRRCGVTCFETVYGQGVRMTSLPPDWLLEDLLLVVDQVKRGSWCISQRAA